MAADTRLPLIDEVGELGPDESGDPMTGNILLFVEESDPVPCVADGATGTIRYVDTYRFVCVYRSATDVSLVTGSPRAHDLVVWRSVPYPNRAQLLAIDDADERARGGDRPPRPLRPRHRLGSGRSGRGRLLRALARSASCPVPRWASRRSRRTST